jgi:restriction endonuclease Mrr
MRELFDEMAKQFRLSDEDLREMLPSGATTTLAVAWAGMYLPQKALLLESPKRGHIQSLLADWSAREETEERRYGISANFSEFVSFQGSKTGRDARKVDATMPLPKHRKEQIENAYRQLRRRLRAIS